MKRRKWIFKLVLAFAIGAVLFSHSDSRAKAAEGKAQKFTANDLEAEVTYGMKGMARFNRYMEVAVKIKNSGGDFSGKVRLLLPYDGTTTMYQKEASIAAGEEKTVKLSVPLRVSEGYFMVYICNGREKPIGNSKIRLSGVFSNEDSRMIGILAENEKELGYFSNKGEKTVYLQAEDISEDYRAMDCLDVLIINNYATGNLKEEQIKAICSWVEKGGTLLLGTGGAAEKVLDGFSGVLLQGSIGKKKILKTRFGVSAEELETQKLEIIQDMEQKKLEQIETFLEENLSDDLLQNYSMDLPDIKMMVKQEDIKKNLLEKFSEDELEEKLNYTVTPEERQEALKNVSNEAVEKEIVQMDLNDAVNIMHDGKDVLLQKINDETGNVLVASFDLALDSTAWHTLGSSIVKVVDANVSKRMDAETSFYDIDYGITQALQVYPTDTLPNVTVYVIILFLYILLAGPVLYFILKRQDKRQLLWALIPVLSVAFSMFIYVTGTSTRIQKYFMTGISILDLDDGEETVWKQNYYSVVPPGNKPFSINVDGSRDITPYAYPSYDDYRAGDGEGKMENFNYGVEYGADKTSLLMEKHSAFEPAFFKEAEPEEVKGTVEIDFHLDMQQAAGTVTNTMEKDLENCCIMTEDRLYMLGDIPAGKSVDLSKVKKTDVDADYIDYDALAQLTDYEKGGYKANKQYSMLETAWNLKLGTNLYGSCFFGFCDEDTDEFGCEMYGMGLVMKSFDIQYNAGENKRQVSLQRYGDAAPDDMQYMDRNTGVNYVLPDGMLPEQLVYPAENSLDDMVFRGEIYARNVESNEMELIFNSSSAGEAADLSGYVKNNAFYLEYRPDEKTLENIGGMRMPNIMIIAEEE